MVQAGAGQSARVEVQVQSEEQVRAMRSGRGGAMEPGGRAEKGEKRADAEVTKLDASPCSRIKVRGEPRRAGRLIE